MTNQYLLNDLCSSRYLCLPHPLNEFGATKFEALILFDYDSSPVSWICISFHESIRDWILNVQIVYSANFFFLFSD